MTQQVNTLTEGLSCISVTHVAKKKRRTPKTMTST